MANIALPTQIAHPNIIALPPQPQNPPTDADFARAVDYVHRVEIANRAGQATPTNLREAHDYKDAIHGAIAGQAVAPPWFAPALAIALAPINLRLDRLSASLNFNHNMAVGGGETFPFKEIPFQNRTYPTALGNNLPFLNNSQAVQNLNGAQLDAYINGYYPGLPIPHALVARRRLVREAIGCSTTD